MARSIFHPDNPLMISIGQITDCIFLSLFWLLGCFPVITSGAAMAALYDASARGLRTGDRHSWQRFVHSFRKNLKASILPAVIFLASGAGLLWLGIRIWNNAVWGNVSWAVFAGFAFAAMVLLGIGSILFPMLSRFENSTAALVSNTIRLGLAHLPRTVGLGLLHMTVMVLCVRYVFPLFFLPCLAALLSSLLIEPMFRPYMNSEEDAA